MRTLSVALHKTAMDVTIKILIIAAYDVGPNSLMLIFKVTVFWWLLHTGTVRLVRRGHTRIHQAEQSQTLGRIRGDLWLSLTCRPVVSEQSKKSMGDE